nr:MAG TPA: hypothetical protein [Bacteriophage sp.]
MIITPYLNLWSLFYYSRRFVWIQCLTYTFCSLCSMLHSSLCSFSLGF